MASAALRNVSNSNTCTGAMALGSTGVRINSDAGTLNLAGNITGSGYALTFGDAGDAVVTGVIGTGTGTLTKDGAGMVVLDAASANTYTGLTTISAGKAPDPSEATPSAARPPGRWFPPAPRWNSTIAPRCSPPPNP